MDGLYWLISFIIVAAIGIWARYWYTRPSGMPEMLKASYSYRTLEYIDFYARRQEKNVKENEISRYDVITYMKKRERTWRQRNDIMAYMQKMDWVYEVEKEGTKRYVISGSGRRELETAEHLRGAVEEAALTLHDHGITSDQAKAAAASIIAAAFRVDARTSPAESRQRADAEGNAHEIEEAVREHDPDKIDRRISRARDILQIATYAHPFATEILRILGL